MFFPLQGCLQKLHVCPLPTGPSGWVWLWMHTGMHACGGSVHLYLCLCFITVLVPTPGTGSLYHQLSEWPRRPLSTWCPQTKRKQDAMWGLSIFSVHFRGCPMGATGHACYRGCPIHRGCPTGPQAMPATCKLRLGPGVLAPPAHCRAAPGCGWRGRPRDAVTGVSKVQS